MLNIFVPTSATKDVRDALKLCVNLRGLENTTPLIEEARSGTAYNVREYLRLGAEKNAQDMHGNAAIHAAVSDPTYGNSEKAEWFIREKVTTIEYLADANADLNLPNKRGQTALMIAANTFGDDPALMQALLAHKEVKLIFPNNNHPYSMVPPLVRTAIAGHVKKTASLLNEGPERNEHNGDYRNYYGEVLSYVAQQASDIIHDRHRFGVQADKQQNLLKIGRLLLEAGANVRGRSGHHGPVWAGPSRSQRFYTDWDASLMSIECGNLPFVKLLAEFGAPLKTRLKEMKQYAITNQRTHRIVNDPAVIDFITNSRQQLAVPAETLDALRCNLGIVQGESLMRATIGS